MKTRNLLMSAVVVAVLCAVVAHAGSFNDPANANVLRQLDSSGNNLVTPANAINNASASGLGVGTSYTVEYVLPEPRTVNSYRLTFGGYGTHRPDTFALRGWTGASWVTLLTEPSPLGANAGTFSSGPQTVTKIELSTSGAPITGYCVPGELTVMVDSSTSTSRKDGLNFLRDATVTSNTSPSIAGIWAPPNSPATIVIDGDYGDGPHLKVLDNGNGQAERVYLAFSLDGEEWMDGARMGFYPGQGWNQPFEVYTATTDLVSSLNAIGTYPDKAAMLSAGWTLQYEATTLQTEPIAIGFLNPERYQYVVWVSDEGQSGATNEFEIFGVIPEPGTITLAGLLSLLMLRRARRHS